MGYRVWLQPALLLEAASTRTARRLGAIWTIRLLLEDPATDRKRRSGARLHTDVAVAVGMPALAEDRRPRSELSTRELLLKRLGELDGEPADQTDAFGRNVAALARLLGLAPVEREIVLLLLTAQVVEGLGHLLSTSGPGAFVEACKRVAIALGEQEKDVRRALDRGGALRETGIVYVDHEEHAVSRFDVMSGLLDAMVMGPLSTRAIMRLFVRDASRTSLDVASFAHASKDVAALIRLLRGALRRRARGVNVLLHGPPGTGKTELTRVLARTLGARLFEVGDASEDYEGAGLDRQRLLRCAVAQRCLARAPRAMLVFDEIEDAFQVDWGGDGLRRKSSGRKYWTHRLIERSPLPTFWVCNEIRQIDPATLRRFDLVVELRVPPPAVRLRMLRDALGKTPVDDAVLHRLAADERLTPAHVTRAVRVMRLMAAREPKDVSDALSLVLSRNLAVQGPLRARSAVQLACGPYSLDFVNAGADLQLVAEALVRQKRGTVCLYGLPGTGKTAWAHHVAQEMGVPMRAARASDLIDCYVGQTEKNIARLFAEAQAEGALLFLDEADSFLQDRANAVRSWEITQVNEMLTQMEGFEGVFICATNLVDSLDRASLRRFAMKIEFKPLRVDARWKMFLRLVPGVEGDRWLRGALDRLDGLTPGDFAAVARQAKLANAEGDPQALVAMLNRELVLRRRGATKSIGFDAPSAAS